MNYHTPKRPHFKTFCPHFAPYFPNFAPIFQFLRCTYVHLVSCGKYLRLGPRNIHFFIISIIWIVFVVTLILYQDSRWAYALDNNIQTLFWKSQEIVSLGNLKESLGNDIFCLTWFHFNNEYFLMIIVEFELKLFYKNCFNSTIETRKLFYSRYKINNLCFEFAQYMRESILNDWSIWSINNSHEYKLSLMIQDVYF